MDVIRQGEPVAPGSCVTVGNFDGVHRAHQLIIRELRAAAGSGGRPAGLVTFEPSPLVVMHRDFPFILTPFAEKQERLALLGLDFVYVMSFDDRLRQLPAQAFLDDMLLKPLRPRLLIVGNDHRFGSDRRGDTALLAGRQAAGHFELKVVPEVLHNGSPVKSTRVRERLVLGAVRDAAELLGYRYAIRGRVVRGRNVGAKLGFPTLNIEPEAPEKLIPAAGVYAVTVQCGMRNAECGMEEQYFGAMNIGFRPTFEGGGQTIEVHILDFDREVYGMSARVELVERLRPERRFGSIDELQNQIAADVALTRIILTENQK